MVELLFLSTAPEMKHPNGFFTLAAQLVGNEGRLADAVTRQARSAVQNCHHYNPTVFLAVLTLSGSRSSTIGPAAGNLRA